MTSQEKLNLVTNYFAEDWAIEKAMQLLEDYDKAQQPSLSAAVGPGEVVAHRLVRKSLSGEWVSDARDWSDGPPSRALVDSICADAGRWRIDVAYAAPTTQPAPQADSVPAPDEILNMAREQGLPETDTEGVFRVNVDDLGRMFAADRAARAQADSVEDAARLEFEMQHGSAIAAARKQGENHD